MASDSVPPVRTSAFTLSSSARSSSRSLFRLSIWRSLPDRKHKVMVCWHRSQAETKYSLLTITGWSEKHPDSPVIEAAVRRPKRLIKYVQLQRKSKTEKLKKTHTIALWTICKVYMCAVPEAAPVCWTSRRRWPRWGARGRHRHRLVALVPPRQGWPPPASRVWPARPHAES